MRFIAAILALLLVVTLAFGEKTASEPTINISVIDKATGDPITGADVTANYEQMSTDDYGQCAVPVPRPGLWHFSITVSQPGDASMAARWERIKADQKLPGQLVFAMTPGTAIGGKVVDEAGKPVAGAAVQLMGGSDENRDGVIHAELLADVRTDADGKWMTNTAPAQLGPVKVKITHADFYSDISDHDAPPTRQLRDRTAVIIIQHGATITGRVLDPAGNPVANAAILASDQLGFTLRHRARTDANGEFSLTQMPLGAATFIVDSNKFAPQMVTTAAPATQPAIIHLEQGARLQLHVLDIAGKPLAGVMVDLEQWQNTNILEYHVRTNADGNAVWLHAPREDLKFNFSRIGLGTLVDHPLTASGQRITITLGPPTHITGSVIDAVTKQPIPNFLSLCGVAAGDDQDVYWQNSAPQTEHAGHFTYSPGETPYQQYQIRIDAAGYLPSYSRRFTDAEGELAMQFKMEKSAPIAGTVYGPAHKSMEHATVYLAVGTKRWVEFDDEKIPAMYGDLAQLKETDATGHFIFPSQAEGFDLICFSDSGFAHMEVPPHSSSLRGNAATTRAASYDLELQPWASVTGKLMIGSRPGAGGKIHIAAMPFVNAPTQPKMSFNYTVTADSSGHFVFNRVPPGKVSVTHLIPHEGGMAFTHEVSIVAVTGQSSSVQIGGTGRAVVGRFQFPAGVRPETLRSFDSALSTYSDVTGGTQMPVAIRAQSQEIQNKWLIAWLQTPPGKAYLAAYDKLQHKFYALTISSDGSFRADDVPAGTYELTATFTAAGPMTTQNFNHPIGSAEKRLTILPMPGGRSDLPLDVGTISVVQGPRPLLN